MQRPIPSLQERLAAAGCRTDHHESDLYVEATETSTGIIRQFQQEGGIVSPERFRSAIDQSVWFDLPFHHDPAIDRRQDGAPFQQLPEQLLDPTIQAHVASQIWRHGNSIAKRRQVMLNRWLVSRGAG